MTTATAINGTTTRLKDHPDTAGCHQSHRRTPAKHAALKYGRSRNQFLRLPFMGKGETIKALCWDLPATGGYVGGYRAGEAMAISFLKYLRDQDQPFIPTELTHIAGAIMERWSQEGGHRMASRSMANQSLAFESIHGQYAGFFNTLLPWIHAAASRLGGNLDSITEGDLIRKANAGLNWDPESEV